MTDTTTELVNTVDRLRREVDEHKYIEVGIGAAKAMGVSKSRLELALQALVIDEGYLRYYVRMTQHGSGKAVTIKVLAVPGTLYKEVTDNITNLQRIV